MSEWKEKKEKELKYQHNSDEKVAPVSSIVKRHGKKPKTFVEAINTGDANLVKEYLDEGTSPTEAASSISWAPIMLAANNGSVPIMELLLGRDTSGQLLKVKIQSGHNPLLIAASKGHVNAVKWLWEHGLSLADTDAEGNTPLLLAVQNSHLSLVKWLVEIGHVSLNVANHKGQTAFGLANKQEIRDFLNQFRKNQQPGLGRKRYLGLLFGALVLSAGYGFYSIFPTIRKFFEPEPLQPKLPEFDSPWLSSLQSDSSVLPRYSEFEPSQPKYSESDSPVIESLQPSLSPSEHAKSEPSQTKSDEFDPTEFELSQPDLPISSLHLRDEESSHQDTAWQKALTDIHSLARERKLQKKVFISHTRPSKETERNELQRWLRQLNDDLYNAGIEVFYDMRNIQTSSDVTKQKQLNESDFIIPILTSEFLQGIQDSGSSVAYEFRSIAERAKTHQSSILPILCSDSLREKIKKPPLSCLPEPLISVRQRGARLRSLLLSLNDPVGLIPIIYNIRLGDKQYKDILQQWKKGTLTRLPSLLSEYIERTELLEQLQKGFEHQREHKQTPIQVIQGIPGVGKTELAIQYANRYSSSEGFVRLIYADSTNLDMEWSLLGELLGLDLKGHEKAEQQRLIRQALQTRSTWVIVLDNMENQEALEGLLPEKRTSDQQVLVTTRSQKWGRLPVLVVNEFTVEESLDYFTQCLKPEQCRGANELGERLGYFPLALSHAVAYMQQTGISAQQYLKRYKEAGVGLLDKETSGAPSSRQYSHTVSTTWFLSIQSLEAHNPMAAKAVKFCAYLSPDQIEARFFQQALGVGDLELDGYMSVIRSYGLLIQEGSVFKMHRLLQEVIRHREIVEFSSQETLFIQRIRPLAKALHALYSFKKNEPGDYITARTMQPHLQAVIEQLELLTPEKNEEGSSTDWHAMLLMDRGNFLQEVSGETNKALKCYEKALAIQLTIYPEEHSDIAKIYNNIGNAHDALGNTKLSLDYHERALAIQLKIYSNEHPHVAMSYNNIGNAHDALGNTKLSLDYHEKALAIQLKIYSNEHPDVAMSYNNIGVTYDVLGDASSALDYHKKSLTIHLKIYSEEHPRVAAIYNNIGNAHLALGDARSALDYHKKALELRLKIYLEEHLDVARSYNNIGKAHLALGDASSALDYHKKALAIFLKNYSEEHPDLARIYISTGVAHRTLGDSKSALDCHKKALAIQLKIYPKEHPNVAASYIETGNAYNSLGDANSALDYHKKALAIQLKIYPKEHPNVAASYIEIGNAYNSLGDANSALDYCKKALGTALKIYPKEHPNVAVSYMGIGNAYNNLGDANSALDYYKKALAIYLKIYPEEHPDVVSSYSNIGAAYNTLGDAKSALNYHKKALAIYLKIYPEEHSDVARSYNNIGNVHLALGDASSALDYHKKALEIRLKIYPEEHPDVARSYSNIGNAHLALGDASSALDYHKKALEIRLKIYPGEHPDVARSYSNIGLSYDELGNYKSARDYYGKALKVYQTLKQENQVNIIKNRLAELDTHHTNPIPHVSTSKDNFWAKTQPLPAPDIVADEKLSKAPAQETQDELESALEL